MNGGKNSPFIMRCRGALVILVYLRGEGGIGDLLSESNLIFQRFNGIWWHFTIYLPAKKKYPVLKGKCQPYIEFLGIHLQLKVIMILAKL